MKKVLVLEAKEIASGQTGRTTAKITGQHGLKYSRLLKEVGEEKARLYAQANEALLREEVKAAAFLGIDAFFTEETELPFPVKGAVCFPDQAQFDAIAFIKYISAELNILEHTQVIKIRGQKVITKD